MPAANITARRPTGDLPNSQRHTPDNQQAALRPQKELDVPHRALVTLKMTTSVSSALYLQLPDAHPFAPPEVDPAHSASAGLTCREPCDQLLALYGDSLDVYNPKGGAEHPAHGEKYDLSIDLVPDAALPKSRLYLLSQSLLATLKDWIRINL